MDKATFYERGEDGLIRLYDMISGEVLQVLGPEMHISRMPAEFSELTREDGSKLLVQKNIPIDEKLPINRGYTFNDILGDLICQEIAGGMSPADAAEKLGVPYSVFSKWRRKYPDFTERLNEACQDRADLLADRALREAEDAASTPGGAAKGKLLVETLWKSAEVANRRKYSPSVKVDASVTVPVQIVIETGIRRSDDPGFLVDETEKLKIKAPVPSLEGGREKEEVFLKPEALEYAKK